MDTTIDTHLRTWIIDPAHSHAGFCIRHLMISKVRGHFSRMSGELQIEEGTVFPRSILVEIEAGSVNTGHADRDQHLRGADFFDVENYPRIIFESTEVHKITDESFYVVGNLTLRGTTNTVIVPVTIEGQGPDPWGGQRVGYSAYVRVDRRDFGLTFNQNLEAGGLAIGNEVDIAFDIEAVALQA